MRRWPTCRRPSVRSASHRRTRRRPLRRGHAPVRRVVDAVAHRGAPVCELIERTQYWGRQMLIWGVHVHVGIDRRDKVLPILDALLNYYPHLLALSASSPMWAGQDTSYASNRAMMFQQLPTAGLPFQFTRWAQFGVRFRSKDSWDHRPHQRDPLGHPAVAASGHHRGAGDGGPTSPSCRRWSRSSTVWSSICRSGWTRARNCRRCRRGWCRRTSGARPATASTPSSSVTGNSMNGSSPTISPICWKHLEPIADSLDCSDELAGIHGDHRARSQLPAPTRGAFARTGSMREVVASVVAEL